MGSTLCKGRGGLGFVPHFRNGKGHWVADGEMFPIRMRKLDNISVRQTYRLKARFVGFWRYTQFQDQSWGLWGISKNVTTVLRNLRSTQQGCRRNMHIDEWTLRPTASALYSPPRRGPFPNYFGETCSLMLIVLLFVRDTETGGDAMQS